MRKFLLPAAAAISLVFAAFIWQANKDGAEFSPYGNRLSGISINGNDFVAETVFTGEKVRLGLSGRESMCEKCGMLFVFPEKNRRSFWMKDMQFDLDIIWISGERIVYVARNVSHEKGTKAVVQPEAEADKVLELNAGISEKFDIKEGDTVRMDQ